MSRLLESIDRLLSEVTTPLPSSFPDSEPGLMTKGEFLEFKNPDNKSHPSSAYDVDIVKMNRNDPTQVFSRRHNSDRYTVYQTSAGGYLIKKDGRLGEQLVAVVHRGTMYYSDKPRPPIDADIGVDSFKQVKYISQYTPLVSKDAKENFDKFPHLIQRIKTKGESLEIRARKKPESGAQEMIVALNQEGLIVARAVDEFKATLIQVVREYRGYGLGRIMAKYWEEINPRATSGGFTAAGRATAISLWQERVREFLARGWYSELIKLGRLTHDRLKDILAGLSGKSRNSIPDLNDEGDADAESEKETLIYTEDGITFAIYDRAFFDDQDEEYIYGYGFFRSARVGTVLYTIDYDYEFRELATYVALQMARDNGEPIYNGEGYTDVLELEGLDHIEQEGDYVRLTKDVIPLDKLTRKERAIRREEDPYDEKKILLIEMAEYKWS